MTKSLSNFAYPSIWDLSPNDDSNYLTILEALDLEPLQVPFDSKVVSITSDKEHPTTITLVTGTGNNTGDIVLDNGKGVETPQVVGDCHWLRSQ